MRVGEDSLGRTMMTFSISLSSSVEPWFELVCILASGCIWRQLLLLSSADPSGRETFAAFIPWGER